MQIPAGSAEAATHLCARQQSVGEVRLFRGQFQNCCMKSQLTAIREHLATENCW